MRYSNHVNDHYFSAQPQADEHPKTITVTLRDRQVNVQTQAGIFSPKGLDKGTAVLLDKVPFTDLPAGALAVDLGCGWGPISLALGFEYPQATVVGVDVNERSIALTKLNADSNELTNVTSAVADGFAEQLATQGRRINLLWSNPPIRIGKEALHALLLQWLPLLADDGVAYLVVQKNLGADSLAQWITAQGFPTTKIGSSKGFRVIEIRRG